MKGKECSRQHRCSNIHTRETLISLKKTLFSEMSPTAGSSRDPRSRFELCCNWIWAGGWFRHNILKGLCVSVCVHACQWYRVWSGIRVSHHHIISHLKSKQQAERRRDRSDSSRQWIISEDRWAQRENGYIIILIPYGSIPVIRLQALLCYT
jgi:hypothetical protein